MRLMAAPTTERSTAAERREEILAAALIEFAERGLHGTSTERIAKRAGISQPYIFRLFDTKKDLFIATVERCMEQTLALFRSSAGGKVGDEALSAIAAAYRGVLEDPVMLRCQMQAYVASDDPGVRAAVRLGYGRLVEFAEQASGAPKDKITNFFGLGMLMNVIASMGLLDEPEPWAARLLEGCGKQL
jgi:AcrR family transcriptional regulator